MRVLMTLIVAIAALFSAPRAAAESAPPLEPTGLLVDDDTPAPDGPEKEKRSPHQTLVGAQAFWAVSKVMPEIVLRFDLHRFFWLDVEAGLVFVTNPPAGHDAFVGSPFGAHVLVAPLRTPRVELGAGLGMDVHYLWGLNSNVAEVALSVIVSGHYWITPKLGVFGSARAYPVATTGLDLGEFRDGSAGLPVLFATGVAWSFP